MVCGEDLLLMGPITYKNPYTRVIGWSTLLIKLQSSPVVTPSGRQRRKGRFSISPELVGDTAF